MAATASGTGPAATAVAAKGCATLTSRLAAIPGGGPAFLPSYDSEHGVGKPLEPALATAAFTYDNALAAIALTACGKAEAARRIGDALLAAVDHDRMRSALGGGRLRNTYRAGRQDERPVPPNGWWDARQNRWLEDAYQVGTATGNVAWAALALLTLAERTGEPRYADGAARLGSWVAETMADERTPAGFAGGLHGFERAAEPLGWKATEHNTDLAAVFRRLAPGARQDWRAREATARGFLEAMWDEERGCFLTGTLPDGTTPNRATSGLDAQLWPLLLPEAPAHWRRALAYAERAHGVPGGFDFNDDRDGLWVEGTAQAALVYRALGRGEEAERLLAVVGGQFSPGGYLWATREPQVTTGLAIGPASRTDDFLYYRQPHLGATAWAVLAATGWNPFTGERVP